MSAWDRVSNVIHIVYRIGRDAETAAYHHWEIAKEFFDYGDDFASSKPLCTELWNPDSSATVSPKRLRVVLENLKHASVKLSEAYKNMAESIDACITMLD